MLIRSFLFAINMTEWECYWLFLKFQILFMSNLRFIGPMDGWIMFWSNLFALDSNPSANQIQVDRYVVPIWFLKE